MTFLLSKFPTYMREKIPPTHHAGGAAVHAGDVGNNAVDLLLVVGAEETTDPPSLPLLLLHVRYALAPSLAVRRLAADVHLRTCKKTGFRFKFQVLYFFFSF
jgi:hypothetical protein